MSDWTFSQNFEFLFGFIFAVVVFSKRWYCLCAVYVYPKISCCNEWRISGDAFPRVAFSFSKNCYWIIFQTYWKTQPVGIYDSPGWTARRVSYWVFIFPGQFHLGETWYRHMYQYLGLTLFIFHVKKCGRIVDYHSHVFDLFLFLFRLDVLLLHERRNQVLRFFYLLMIYQGVTPHNLHATPTHYNYHKISSSVNTQRWLVARECKMNQLLSIMMNRMSTQQPVTTGCGDLWVSVENNKSLYWRHGDGIWKQPRWEKKTSSILSVMTIILHLLLNHLTV